jgi:hypothetical protein
LHFSCQTRAIKVYNNVAWQLAAIDYDFEQSVHLDRSFERQKKSGNETNSSQWENKHIKETE